MRFVLTVLAGTFSVTLLAHTTRADNNTACGAVLCLDGEVMGQLGGAGCTNYLNAYFSIAVAGDTMSVRGNFLDECSSSSSNLRSSVNSQFGPLEFLP